MNTPQQVDAVKAIIKIKNKILHSGDLDEIADLMQNAIDISSGVPANSEQEKLDRTMTKEWNVISIKRLMRSVKERDFNSLESVYPQVAASLLRLAMIFVKGGLEDVNKILAESLLNKGIFRSNAQADLKRRS